MRNKISEVTLEDGRTGFLYSQDETKVEFYADGISSLFLSDSVAKITYYSLIDNDEDGEHREVVARVVMPMGSLTRMANSLQDSIKDFEKSRAKRDSAEKPEDDAANS